jgi:hypothetical protein
MRALINGKDIGEYAPSASVQYGDTTLTQNDVICFYGYRSTGSNFRLDATFGAPDEPAPKPGTPVTVKIIPTDFAGPDWRLEVVRQTPGGG